LFDFVMNGGPSTGVVN